MALADGLREILFSSRSVAGQLGLRPHRVYMTERSFPEERFGGVHEDDRDEITEGNSQPPKVRWLTGEELALGNFARETVEVGPITPRQGATGTALSQLVRNPDCGDEFFFIIEGPRYPSGGRFVLRRFVPSPSGLNYMLTLEKVADAGS